MHRNFAVGARFGRLAAVPALLTLLAGPVAGQATTFRSGDITYRAVTVVDGLEQPWSLAFLPGGDMLVTEKPGRLRIVRNGALLPTPVPGVPAVRFRGQGGLLDVALHPDFATNRLIYLSYSKPNADGSQGTTAVSRGRFVNDRLEDVEEIFEAQAWSTGNGHYGSRLAFDADGYLYVTVGDRQAPPTGDLTAHPAQDLSNHQGTINRLHDDGRIPSDNPFVNRSGAQPSIWSYGHRSPQGLAFNPVTGELWQSEHGPQGGDELNLIRRGGNYGWPVIGYGVNYGGAPLHASRTGDGMEQPIQYFTPSPGISGLMIYTGDRFPAWTGSAFTGGMAIPQLLRVPMVTEDFRVGRMEGPLLLGFSGIRDVRQGPDGLIYVVLDPPTATELTRIVRLEPVADSSGR
jgi:glucose/arabinose dehydrogenase